MGAADGRRTGQVSAHADPVDEAPWAMQLVVRAEKADRPTRTAACEAAAMAVVHLLADPRASTVWKPQIDRWLDGRIRKLCRRARGSRWQQVQQLAGVTVEHAGAQVRAFVPSAVDEVPAELSRLQLNGSPFGGPAPPPSARTDPGAVVVTLPAAHLPDGKAAAACAHAAQLAWMRMPADVRRAWADGGYLVRVEQPDQDRFDRLAAVSPVEVVDAGFTVVAAGTTTALARWSSG